MGTIVQKYGGTSIEGRDRIMAVAKRVAALKRGGHDVVVVVSAPGGTTDSLLESASALCAQPTQRELDMLMTAGERISMSLLAIALNSIGCPAISFTGSQVGIITDTAHTDARILEVRPGRLIRELKEGKVVVVGGFQGVSTAKDVTTLGRGGSDTTAVALAAALGAERCEILTDVDGVYTADPNVVPDARRISELSYEDMCELARFGATVLKEEAVRFAERHGIAIHVGKSDSETPGTIVLEKPAAPDRPVTGLSLSRNLDLVRWVGQSAGRAVADLGRMSRHTRFFSMASDVAFAAVDRAGGGIRPDHDLGETSSCRADLICMVGREAGSAQSVAVAAQAIGSSGNTLLAAAARGRSTVLAVEPGRSADLLRLLHELFFPAEAAPDAVGTGNTPGTAE